MSDAELKGYDLIIPGGNFEEIGKALTADTTARLRNAVSGGLSYLGICAGAFFAGASPYSGLNLTSGVRFPFYALEDQGIRKAAVGITTADAPPLEVYWEDGPQLTGWGAVVARYPDNTPPVVQGSFGRGMGGTHRRSRRSAGELAPRPGVHHAGRSKPCLCSPAHRRGPPSQAAAAPLTSLRIRAMPDMAWRTRRRRRVPGEVEERRFANSVRRRSRPDHRQPRSSV
jgi:hypothetical protein